VSPHDSTGSNLIVQVKNNKVMRVVPLENEAVNECWIADRDRFSYEALNSDERLTTPMIKQGGEWRAVDWQTALEYIANGLKQIVADHGPESIGTLASAHSTLEELFLAGQLMRGLGSQNIDYRLRHAEFPLFEGARYLGTSIASLSDLQRVLIVGSNLRKEHPLFAQRIRQSARKGGVVSAITTVSDDWALPVAHTVTTGAAHWLEALAAVAASVAAANGIEKFVAGTPTPTSDAIARSLLGGERKAILLGNAAAHHDKASSLLAIANWIGLQTGATVGYLTEAANTVGAQIVGAMPGSQGLNAGQMLSGALKAVVLLNNEPEFDSASGAQAKASLMKAQMVVTMSPFKANMAFSDVLLPIAPFTETSGTFVNAEGRAQSFHAVVKPLAETRPAWKVLRVLANVLGLPGFEFESTSDVLKQISADESGAPFVVNPALLVNHTDAKIDLTPSKVDPVTARIYSLDGTVRRASSLQLTADAKSAEHVLEVSP
jgi:NADH-quinone oxidoreductase subunit G